MATFGEQLAAARKKRGITQEQLADTMNMTRQGISHWETGRTLPDAETLKHLSQVLDYNFEMAEEAPAAEETAAPAPVPAKKRNWGYLVSFLAGAVVTALLMVLVPQAITAVSAPKQAEVLVRPQA